MDESMENKKMEKLKEENKNLKKALSLCLNKPLVKRLHEAIERIKKGEFITEEEFFRDSPRLAA